MYMTGGGAASAAVTDGAIVGDPGPAPKEPITIVVPDPTDPFGDAVLAAEVISAGGVPENVTGLLAVRFRIPAGTQPGPAVEVHFWQASAPYIAYAELPVTIAVR
jgi:uncharacterized protein (TIGR03437 family)